MQRFYRIFFYCFLLIVSLPRIHSFPKHKQQHQSQSVSKSVTNALWNQKKHSSLILLASNSQQNPLCFITSRKSFLGGFLSGGLHSISGPDHLAAVIPGSVQKKGLKGAVIGALWGLGHSLSSSILGSLVYFLKGEINNRFHLFKKLSIIADFVVGLTLISIGIVGIKESRSLLKKDNQENVAKSFATSFSVFVNGFLHGFSWDGIPSLAPTLTLQSFQSVLSFLTAYSIGTMVTMSLCGALVSMISDNLLKGSKDERRAMNTLSFISSIFAVVIGIYWVIQGIAS